MRQLFTPLPHAFPEFQQSLHRLFCTRRSFHKLSRVPVRVQRQERAPASRKIMAEGYEKWSQQQLIARIQELEQQAKSSEGAATQATGAPTTPAAPTLDDDSKPAPFCKPPKAPPKAFDASKYSTRLIALKFAYLGQKYNGFEHHNNNKTPLPTIEEELWKALIKTRVISPAPPEGSDTDYSRVDRKTFAAWDRDGADVNWDGCDYSKCGRTDRGVSAFGQVVGIRVRSNRPLPKTKPAESPEDLELDAGTIGDSATDLLGPDSGPATKPFNDLTDELPYIQLLNRVLPPDIRVYAWCPNPPADFSARFSCKERRYKYFFTNPCFAPVPGSAGLYHPNSSTPDGQPMREGWLDVAAMQDGCDRLVGLHDFRNFCKIDASKQLTNFKRRIFHASIDEVSLLSIPSFLSHAALQSPTAADQAKMYCFTLHGSAFLWHQVRSLISILFLIGQRLESPSLVTALLDMDANPTRPKYEMASDAPLVLWDCIFPHASEVQSSEERETGYQDRLQWVYVGDEGGVESKSTKTLKGIPSMGRGKWGRGGVVDDVWEVWRGDKIDETLSGLLLDRISNLGDSTLDREMASEAQSQGATAKGGPRVFDGGNFGRAKGNYIPVLQRERQEPVEVVNERYAKKKGLDPNRYKNVSEEDAGE
ncbi:tRNA pseudouridine(38/39) synthase [Ascochyta rabiei]|uniref:Pseudouridine synthase n=1 Tax=Didymella rabiei TaxID=5454 RepID=A0A162W9Y8_DIDRA|nr:tRNA pseudouridine(38/39) synthase [Ascochyta rabiei]KZM18902.1 pseudouridine synthase [Ascochyta rabiei]UPX20138.1 tRNA pseudouridine(38/39) synthase [Ascochyta rabiei]